MVEQLCEPHGRKLADGPVLLASHEQARAREPDLEALRLLAESARSAVEKTPYVAHLAALPLAVSFGRMMVTGFIDR